MWFKSNIGSRRRSRKSKKVRSSFLRVNMNARGRSAARFRLIKVLTALIGVAGVGLLLKIGTQWTARLLLSDNDLFRIDRYDIRCFGDVIRPEHVMEYTGLNSYSNLFAVDMSAVHASLGKVPRIKSVGISRYLNGVLSVEVRERAPVARLFMDGYFLSVDASGYVLGPSTGSRSLPVISDHHMAGLKPGVFLGKTPLMNALEVLDVCESTPVGRFVAISDINIGDDEALKIRLSDGAVVMLAWKGMGRQTEESRDNLEYKMIKLAENIREAGRRGERILEIDMTVERNFPARFVRR